jgi:hypothetical protein
LSVSAINQQLGRLDQPRPTRRLAQALINAGKPFDMFVVPQANHHFATKAEGPAEPYVSGLRTKYLVEHLMPGVNAP